MTVTVTAISNNDHSSNYSDNNNDNNNNNKNSNDTSSTSNKVCQYACCRTLLASLLLCGAATSTLVWAPSKETVLLFLGRAAVMASYTTLYVYTPEVGL